ncbi:MAG: heme-binding protein [Bifidobacteriaceae bacterium]|nr:heme-binding protein [Bifidobacteriaceae bacterium]
MTSIPSLDYRAARAAADHAAAAALDAGLGMTVVVVDAAGLERVRLRLDGGSIASATLAGQKAMTALTTRTATADWVRLLAERPAVGPSVGAFPAFCCIPGGVPINVEGQVIGAVGVSGGTFDQDQAIAEAAAAHAAQSIAVERTVSL